MCNCTEINPKSYSKRKNKSINHEKAFKKDNKTLTYIFGVQNMKRLTKIKPTKNQQNLFNTKLPLFTLA